MCCVDLAIRLLFTIPGLDGDNLKLIDEVEKQTERAAALEAILDEPKKVGKTLAVLLRQKRGQKFSYAVRELAMRLMARGMTPAMARGALRGVRTLEDPDAKLHDTYSLMRLQIDQLTHHVVALWSCLCDQWYSIHDAATKKRLRVFHHAVTGEKDGNALTLGQFFSIIKKAQTETEADAVEAGLISTLVENEPVSATLKTCRSCTSDNATLSVSKELRKR